MKAIIVTGTPGTGKTTISKELSKILDYEYIDVNEIIRAESLGEGFDKKRGSTIVNVKKLSGALRELIRKKRKQRMKGIVIDSHLSHYVAKSYVNECIVVKCSNLKILKRRLKERGYSKEKVRENLDSEIFAVCLIEAKERGHNVFVVDTSNKEDVRDFLGYYLL